MTDRVAQIRSRLEQAFDPSELEVIDQSHLHAGHAGAKDGRGHFKVRIVSERFRGHARIDRHRMVHEVLSELFATDIHALSLKATTAEEHSAGR